MMIMILSEAEVVVSDLIASMRDSAKTDLMCCVLDHTTVL